VKSRFAGIAQVALAACTWGTWSLFLRPAHLSPWHASPIVFVVIAVVGLAISVTEPKAKWDRRAVVLLLLLSVFDVLNVVTFFLAIERTTVAVATLTHYLAPVLVALAAPFVDGRRVRGTLPAAFVALTGLTLVLAPWEPGHLGGDVVLGALFGATSAVAYAVNVFVVVRLAPAIGSARAVGWHAVIGVLLLVPLVALGGAPHFTPSAVALVAAGGALPGTIASWLFARGAQLIGGARASVLAYLEPVVAVAVGMFAFGEPVSPWALLGGALILGAGVFVTLPRAPGAER